MFGTGNRCADFAAALAEGERRRVNRRNLYPVLVAVVLSVGLSLVPLDVDFGCRDVTANPAACLTNCAGVNIQRSEALANPAVAPYAFSFVEASAAAAGLTTGDYIISCLQMLSVTSGVSLLNGEVKMGVDSAGDVLEKLIQTAEWQYWDDMTEEEQLAWGSEMNYKAAQFNEYAAAFGLAQARDTFYSNGGGDFDEGTTTRLERIGAIGANWALNVKNPVDTILETVTDLNSTAIRKVLARSSESVIDTSIYPSGLPTNIVLGYGSYFELAWRNSGGTNYNWKNNCNAGVVRFVFQNPSGSFKMLVASPVPFRDSAQNITVSSGTTYDDRTVYFYNSGSTGTILTSTSGLNELTSAEYNKATDNLAKVAWSIVYGISSSSAYLPGYDGNGQYPPDIDYPGEYAGGDEIGPSTEWDSLFGDEPGEPSNPDNPDNPDNPGSQRPSNPYNPDNQTGGQQWRDETEENVLPLAGIRFDNLFPFSMLYDIPKLMHKVETFTYTESASGDYLYITIPFDWGEHDEDLVLDLRPLHTLFMMIRPFNLLLLIAGLLFAAIAFWRNILTG